MSDPIFVRSRHEYSSYQDYWRLVELAGFPTCYNDELDPASDHTYIVAVRNGENDEGWPGARARIIHWHLEFHVQYGPWAGVAETWSPDAWHAQQINGHYVPMGGDARLNPEPSNLRAGPYEYDAAYYGYMVNRRSTIATHLRERGVMLSPAAGWGDQRHDLLHRSLVYVHVHQTDDAPAIPALRMVVAAAYALPVLMELPAERGLYGYAHFMASRYDYLAEFVRLWTGKERGVFLEDFGWALNDLLCTRLTFRKSVEGAL